MNERRKYDPKLNKPISKQPELMTRDHCKLMNLALLFWERLEAVTVPFFAIFKRYMENWTQNEVETFFKKTQMDDMRPLQYYELE